MSTTYNMTKPARIVFVNLDKPKAYKPPGQTTEGKPKYSANFVFDLDHPDLPGIKAAAIEAAKAGWPGRELKEIHWPWFTGDSAIAKRQRKAQAKGQLYKPERDEYMKGKLVMPGRSTQPIALSGVEGGQIVDYDNPLKLQQVYKKMFYPGVEVLGTFTFVPYPGVGNDDAVACYLNLVLSTGKGTRIQMGMTAQEAFSGVLGQLTAEDPTAGVELEDEQIPW